MRFKIDFKLLGEPPFSIPVNYQSEFSAWIHKILHFHDNAFTNWLKEKKYLDSTGEYKLFTFSDVVLPPHKLHDDRYQLEGDTANVVISFYAGQEIRAFIESMFPEIEFKMGDSRGKVALKVESIKHIEHPEFNEKQKIKFSCLSPMLLSEPGNNSGAYISPEQKDFDKVFFKSLMFKYANLVKYMSQGNGLTGLNDLQFKMIGKPKSKTVKIKTDTPHQKAVKGYVFDFEIKAPLELLQIGYNAGFGELNHLGFGCCEIKK